MASINACPGGRFVRIEIIFTDEELYIIGLSDKKFEGVLEAKLWKAKMELTHLWVERPIDG